MSPVSKIQRYTYMKTQYFLNVSLNSTLKQPEIKFQFGIFFELLNFKKLAFKMKTGCSAVSVHPQQLMPNIICIFILWKGRTMLCSHLLEKAVSFFCLKYTEEHRLRHRLFCIHKKLAWGLGKCSSSNYCWAYLLIVYSFQCCFKILTTVQRVLWIFNFQIIAFVIVLIRPWIQLKGRQLFSSFLLPIEIFFIVCFYNEQEPSERKEGSKG